jgi:hypothetical protein
MVGPGIWQETVKTMKNVKYTNRTWVMATKQKNGEKDTKNTVSAGLWGENWKTWKMRNSHGRTTNMARNTEKRSKGETHTISTKICQEKVKNVNNEKYTL